MFIDIRADDSAMKAQVNGLKSELGTMGVAIGSVIGNIVTGAISKATAAMTAFVTSGIKGSVELQDTVQAIGVVFGQSASIITKEADAMALHFGIVKGEFVGAASMFGQVFQGLGKSQEDAAKMGVTLAKLGLDLKSFKGGATTTQDAMTALGAAFRGEFNPLEQFNVFLTADMIATHALSMGLAKTATALTDVDKKMATLDLIMKKTTNQQGDLARTSDQMGNSWTKLTGTIANLSVAFADALGPALAAMLADAVTAASALRIAWEENQKAFAAGVETTVEGSKTSTESIGMIGMAVGKIADAWRVVSIGFATMELQATKFVRMLEQGLTAVMNLIGKIPGIKVEDTGGFHKAFAEDLDRLVEKQELALGELANKPWPTEAVEAYFKKARDETAALKVELAKATAPTGALIGGLGMAGADLARRMTTATEPVKKAADKTKEFKSETIGSADFASKLRESIFSAKDATGSKALEAAERTAKATEEAAEALKRPRAAVMV